MPGLYGSDYAPFGTAPPFLKHLFESYRNLIYMSIAICVIG